MTGRICGKVRFEPGAKQLLAAPLISADVIYVPLWYDRSTAVRAGTTEAVVFVR